MQLFWTDNAFAQRLAIFDYIANDNPAAAIALDEHFLAVAQQLKTFPLLGKPGRVEDTREIVVCSPYILVYEVVDEAINILAVHHGAQDSVRTGR